MKAIEINGLSYKYDDGTVAIKNLDLSITQGERVAILGPNGAGKSTLLRIIAGLQYPYDGTIKIFGEKMTKKNSEILRQRLGLLFQDPDDQIFMPRVWEDIAFGPINLGLNELEVKARVELAMKHTELLGFDERSAHHLSYGEKKRVAIAGIIAMRPNILLLDEFTANLDPKGREDIISVIKKLDTTLIITTHDINTAIRLADSALVLNEKKLYHGSMKDVFGNESLLKTAHLDVPDIAKLFLKLRNKGLKLKNIPLTVDQGYEYLNSEGIIGKI